MELHKILEHTQSLPTTVTRSIWYNCGGDSRTYLGCSTSLKPTIFSSPHASSTATTTCFSPLSTSLTSSSATFLSSSVGSPTLTRVGKLRSSLVVPSSFKRLTSPESGSAAKH